MVLVDTSVWIDFLAGRENPAVAALIALLEAEEDIAYTGLILQELLQGVPEAEQAVVENHFQPFIELTPVRSTHLLAARIYRDARKRGFTIRSSIDCLIAACAIEHDCAVLHNDRDYTVIARVAPLEVHLP